MKITKKSKCARIRDAALKDGINYIIGLAKVPVPLEILKEIIGIKIEDSPSNFVDWELEDWPRIYESEVSNCLIIFYKGKKLLLPQVLIFDNTQSKFDFSKLYFECDKSNIFRITDDIRALSETSFVKLLQFLRNNTNFSNEQNLRLINIIKGDKITFQVQPVEYKCFLHTNLVLDVKSNEKNQSLREYIHTNGKLEELNKSPLANNLGINLLLFTADGSLVLQKRSKKVAFYRGQIFPSTSGTFSLTDIPNGNHVSKLSFNALPKLREAYEELGLKKKDIHFISFLGITRELIRGGEPDTFFVAKSNLSENEVNKRWKDARDKWESEKLLFFNFGILAFESLENDQMKHQFFSKIDKFIDKYIDNCSMPLLASIALWINYRLKSD